MIEVTVREDCGYVHTVLTVAARIEIGTIAALMGGTVKGDDIIVRAEDCEVC